MTITYTKKTTSGKKIELEAIIYLVTNKKSPNFGMFACPTCLGIKIYEKTFEGALSQLDIIKENIITIN